MKPTLNRIFLAALLALVSAASAAAGNPNQTTSRYNPGDGTAATLGVVLTVSEDGVTSVPVNTPHPLPVTVVSGGGGGGGGAATIADGADVAQGATTDAAATAGGAGTSEAKLRLITSQLGASNTSLSTIASNTASNATTTLQTAGNASLATIATNTGTLGQKTMSASQPMTIASDQSSVPVSGIYNSTPPTLTTGTPGQLQVDSRNSLKMTLVAPDSTTAIAGLQNNSDGLAVSSSTARLGVVANILCFNGTTWDRCPGDVRGQISHGAPQGTITDGSGTVTTGLTSQQVFAANTSRLYLMCQNPASATETLFINIGAAASTTAASYELAAGGSLTFTGAGMIPTGTVNVTAITIAHRFVCKQG